MGYGMAAETERVFVALCGESGSNDRPRYRSQLELLESRRGCSILCLLNDSLTGQYEDVRRAFSSDGL